jgi:heat shock protein HslJ
MPRFRTTTTSRADDIAGVFAARASLQRIRAGSAVALCVAASIGCAAARSANEVGLAPEPGAATRSEAAAAPSDFFGIDWVFVAIAGFDGPLPSPPPVAGFNATVEARRMTGTTACNRMSSGYEIDFETGRLRFTNLRNTRMLCDRVAADTQEEVLQALIATDSFRIAGGHLELYGKGRLLARLQPGT